MIVSRTPDRRGAGAHAGLRGGARIPNRECRIVLYIFCTSGGGAVPQN